MTCGRCGGLMVVEPIFGATGSTMSGEPREGRCLNCGNVEDAVVVANRVLAQSARGVMGHNIGVEVKSSMVTSSSRKTLDDR